MRSRRSTSFVPVLGYLDDLLIVPLGILLAVWLIPAPLMAEFREVAASRAKPVSRAGLHSSLSSLPQEPGFPVGFGRWFKRAPFTFP